MSLFQKKVKKNYSHQLVRGTPEITHLLQWCWHEHMYQVVKYLARICSRYAHVHSSRTNQHLLSESVGQLLGAVQQAIMAQNSQSFQLCHHVVCWQTARGQWGAATIVKWHSNIPQDLWMT